MTTDASPKDFYSVLGISADATDHEVKQAYRRCAQFFHPDRFATSTEDLRRDATSRMGSVNEAYEVLRDPERRAAYDRSRRDTPLRPSGAAPIPASDRVELDLGIIDAGSPDGAGAWFVLLNRGGPATRVRINPSQSWIHFSLVPLSAEDLLPAQVLVEVDTDHLEPGCSYRESITIELDGSATTVPVRFTTRSARPSSRHDRGHLPLRRIWWPHSWPSNGWRWTLGLVGGVALPAVGVWIGLTEPLLLAASALLFLNLVYSLAASRAWRELATAPIPAKLSTSLVICAGALGIAAAIVAVIVVLVAIAVLLLFVALVLWIIALVVSS